MSRDCRWCSWPVCLPSDPAPEDLVCNACKAILVGVLKEASVKPGSIRNLGKRLWHCHECDLGTCHLQQNVMPWHESLYPQSCPYGNDAEWERGED